MKDCPTPNVHVCGKCSLNHFTKDCESFESLCINCVKNDTAGADHLTRSYNCPRLKIQKELLKSKLSRNTLNLTNLNRRPPR